MAIEISDVDELQAMSSDLTADYEIVNDIDASATSGWNSGAGWSPVGPNTSNPFTGSLLGGGFAVTDLTINRTSTSTQGLFGVFMGDVSDLRLVDVNITALHIVGAFWGNGYIGSGGGGGSAVRCGVVGGNVRSTRSAATCRCGGFQGQSDHVGGATITDCYSTAAVTATNNANDVGGFSGRYRNTITRCYTACVVTSSGSNIDGFGDYISGTTTHCFWDTTIGPATSSSGTGKTTAEMQDIDTFTTGGPTWDMVDESAHDGELATAVWFVDDGADYPRLWFEYEGSPAIPEGSGTGSLELDATGVGQSTRYGSGTGALELDAAGLGQSVRYGYGTGALELDATGIGQSVRYGFGVGPIELDAVGVGVSARSGLGVGDLELSGTGTGQSISNGGDVGQNTRSGYGIGELELNATGTGPTTSAQYIRLKLTPTHGITLRVR